MQTVVTLIDVVVSARPWRYSHVCVSLIYGFVYVSFQLIYILGFDGTDASGNDWIYPIMKWKTEPGQATLWVGLVLLVAALGHGLLCLLAFIRDKTWEKYFSKSLVEDVALELANVKHYNSVKA